MPPALPVLVLSRIVVASAGIYNSIKLLQVTYSSGQSLLIYKWGNDGIYTMRL